MITPAFELSQDPDFLTVTIRVPYTRVSEFDIYCEGEDFKFFAKPYFLRLTLPGRIVEDGREHASYDAEKGIITVQMPKETPGQHFEGLTMLTALLAPKGTRSAKPLVEEMGAPVDLEEEDEFDWQIEQTPFEEIADDILNLQCSYGFGDLRSGVFRRLQDELSDVIDLRDPDVTSQADRRQKRLAAEDAKFDPDHYLADLFEDEAIQHILTYKAWWATATGSSGKTEVSEDAHSQEHGSTVSFTEEEKQQLRKFTNKSYLLDKRSHRRVFLSLIDLLLAYVYEICVTEGEKNVESSWNIRKLSGTLCWLESYSHIQDVLVSFGRRVLCYPLYRHFSLVTKAIQDVTLLLQMGKVAVLKCLLDVHKIFQENDPAYILNDLYVADYCIWIQKVKSKKLARLGKCLQTARLTKADLKFELEELEIAAHLVKEEEDKAQAASGLLDTADLETSDTEGSSSTSASETEESESSEEENVQINHSEDDFRKDSTVTSIDNSEWSKTTDLQSASAAGGVIEKLGDKLCNTVVLSEKPEGSATESCSTLQNETEQHAVEFVRSVKKLDQEAKFLEVSPRKNPLLLVGSTDYEGNGVD